MTIRRLGTVAFCVLGLAAAGTLAGAGGAAQLVHAPPAPFKHIIIIVQENRTPDNLFHGLCVPPFTRIEPTCSTHPGPGQYDIETADWKDKTAPSGVVQPQPIPLANTYDLGHSHGSFVSACDLNPGTKSCRMDGSAAVSCRPAKHQTCPPRPQFRYIDNTSGTVTPYLELATQYGWANAMFQSNQGPSYPAHQFLFGGTSAPDADDDRNGVFVSENLLGTGAVGGFNKKAGCASPRNTRTTVLHPDGTTQTMYPCFEHKTMPDVLGSGVTWRYYVPSPGSIWTAPNSIRHICRANGHTTTSQCVGPIWRQHVTFHPPNVWADIDSCTLRAVSWVIPAGPYSDHAGPKAGDGGPRWVASIVNRIGKSACEGGYWKNTAIVVTWDDWGGWYDHVPPPFAAGVQGDYEHGFRVPLIVVSAYTPKGYINNAQHDFGSILRFVQHNFGIAEGALGFDDSRATTDLRAFFTLPKPRPFVPIVAPSLAPAHRVSHDEPDDG
jgi:phospholipase C